MHHHSQPTMEQSSAPESSKAYSQQKRTLPTVVSETGYIFPSIYSFPAFFTYVFWFTQVPTRSTSIRVTGPRRSKLFFIGPSPICLWGVDRSTCYLLNTNATSSEGGSSTQTFFPFNIPFFFFRKQLNPQTWAHQAKLWQELIISYCRFHRLFKFELSPAAQALPVFNNSSISRTSWRPPHQRFWN